MAKSFVLLPFFRFSFVFAVCVGVREVGVMSGKGGGGARMCVCARVRALMCVHACGVM